MLIIKYQEINEKLILTNQDLDHLSNDEIIMYIKDIRYRILGSQIMSNYHRGRAELLCQIYESKNIDDERWAVKTGKIIFGVNEFVLHLTSPTIGEILDVIQIASHGDKYKKYLKMYHWCNEIIDCSCFTESHTFPYNTLNSISQNLFTLQQDINSQSCNILPSGEITVKNFQNGFLNLELNIIADTALDFKLVIQEERDFIPNNPILFFGKSEALVKPFLFPSDSSWIKLQSGKFPFALEVNDETSYIKIDLLYKSKSGIYGLDTEYYKK